MNTLRHIDTGSKIVMLITFILFIGALFTKGFTHDLLLESGVFLVSVKLIIMAFRHNVAASEIKDELVEIKKLIYKYSKSLKEQDVSEIEDIC